MTSWATFIVSQRVAENTPCVHSANRVLHICDNLKHAIDEWPKRTPVMIRPNIGIFVRAFVFDD